MKKKLKLAINEQKKEKKTKTAREAASKIHKKGKKQKTPTSKRKSIVAVQWTLKTRLLILVITSLIFTSAVISFIAFEKSKESTMTAVEQRLERETTLFYQMVQNLMYVYDGNPETFRAKQKM